MCFSSAPSRNRTIPWQVSCPTDKSESSCLKAKEKAIYNSSVRGIYFTFSGVEMNFSMVGMVRNILAFRQGCSGAGTRGNGVPTPFSRFPLK